jgi:SAM-dependent methyltransferase
MSRNERAQGKPLGGLDEPEFVQRQYASDSGLAARQAAYENHRGPDAREVVFQAVTAATPQHILDVGCGRGELASRMRSALGAEVVAVDQSPRMVELTAQRGVDARVADVQALPFPNGTFDVVVAAWVLFHVPNLDTALTEIARVLEPGGRLVAATNRGAHLAEVLALAGLAGWEMLFSGENGESILQRHFVSVESTRIDGTVTFPDIDAVRAYYASSELLAAYAEALPDRLSEPLVALMRPIVFVAEKAS